MCIHSSSGTRKPPNPWVRLLWVASPVRLVEEKKGSPFPSRLCSALLAAHQQEDVCRDHSDNARGKMPRLFGIFPEKMKLTTRAALVYSENPELPWTGSPAILSTHHKSSSPRCKGLSVLLLSPPSLLVSFLNALLIALHCIALFT